MMLFRKSKYPVLSTQNIYDSLISCSYLTIFILDGGIVLLWISKGAQHYVHYLHLERLRKNVVRVHVRHVTPEFHLSF